MKILVLIFFLHALYTEGQPQPLVKEPVRVSGKVLSGSATGTCPSQQDMLDIHNQFSQNELRRNISINLTKDLKIYSCGGVTGWKRVGFLDMTDPSQSCPSGLALKTYSPGLRSCGRATDNSDCWSTFYNTGGSPYSRVCGRVRGYHFGLAAAFYGTTNRAQNINGYYVDGVSLTHGDSNARTHIWTFASSLSETYVSNNADHFCRCVTEQAPPPPSFAENYYFCESGLNTVWDHSSFIFYPGDPLWDGQNCASSSCCEFNNPPYFTRTLPAPTSDDIELRICALQPYTVGGTLIDQVELYVK